MDTTARLIKTYQTARERVIQEMERLIRSGQSYATEKKLLKVIDKELARLGAEVREWAGAAVQESYLHGALDAARAKYGAGAQSAMEAFSGLHTGGITLCVDNARSYLTAANGLIARQAKDAVRSLGLNATLEHLAGRTTWRDMKTALEAMLKDEGFLTVPWRNGKGNMRLDSYAELVARTTTREATTTGLLNQLDAMGEGLVKLSSHSPTCKVCAARQGRVYRLTDYPADDERSRFPHISQGLPRWPSYKTLHPNCRHVLMAFIWTEKSRAEQEAALGHAGDDFDTDKRSEKEIAAYEHAQDVKRRRLADRKQWERYRAVLGEKDTPSFSGFRAMKKAGSERYQFMRLDYQRQNRLLEHPEHALPNAMTSTAADTKFTKYLFNENNAEGWAKGVAFDHRLGYNISNWEDMQKDILSRASRYPVITGSTDQYGTRYEQQVVLYGLKGRPANVIVGWKIRGQETWMTTTYISEVKRCGD